MKLRLRSFQTKETIKIEVPNSCTFLQFTQTLSLSLPLSSPSPSSISFSLNRKDELHVSSPEESLQSLGITSGDLIYFSLNPESGSSSSSTGNLQQPIIDQPVNCPETERLGRVTADFHEKNETLVNKGEGDIEGSLVNSLGPGSKICGIAGGSVVMGSNYANRGTPDDAMPVDGKSEYDLEEIEFGGEEGVDVVDMRFSEPYFLRRVLREELGGDGSVKKLLVVAVHAVFLESGFVGFNSVTGMRVDGFHVVDEWPSKAFTMSLWYTLPELMGNEVVAKSVKLKFQSLGNFVNVYGSLAKGGSELYRVCLDESKFGPPMDLLWANCDKNVEMDENVGVSRAFHEPKVFEFWKIVKDGLTYPLLIELCDKTGLALPPCLMRLPVELKLKVLESLSWDNIAIMASVCTEWRYLSSNNELWKQKFEQQFGTAYVVQGTENWKERFASFWVNERLQRYAKNRPTQAGRWPHFPVIWRDPDPLRFPAPVVGVDYDGLFGFGVPSPFGRRRRQGCPLFQRRPLMAPSCNLGGFNT